MHGVAMEKKTLRYDFEQEALSPLPPHHIVVVQHVPNQYWVSLGGTLTLGGDTGVS